MVNASTDGCFADGRPLDFDNIAGRHLRPETLALGRAPMSGLLQIAAIRSVPPGAGNQ